MVLFSPFPFHACSSFLYLSSSTLYHHSHEIEKSSTPSHYSVRIQPVVEAVRYGLMASWRRTYFGTHYVF